MRIVSRGRIVLWEGASLWTFDVPSAPEGPASTRLHAHHALQLTLAAGGRFRIRTQSRCLESPAVLIGSDVPHAFESEGRIALLFVEPESRPGQALMRRLAGAPAMRLAAGDPAASRARLAPIWADPRPDRDTIVRIGQALLETAMGEALAASTLDPRIARALAWLAPRLGGRVGLAEAAGVACLSPSRFSHLFAAEVGLPFRSYLLWRRLMRAVEQMAGGASLTAAAYEAGFADSAHFSRTFHRMFGLPPAALQIT